MVSFSVLIITHGREELLLKCLDSLRPQGATWQLVIVANGIPVSDGVVTKAKALTSEVDILSLAERERPGKSRNLGIELVRHEWTFLIDDDAYAYPRYFETALPLLQQEGIDVLGGPDAPAKGMDYFSQALALTLTSPFCTGPTFGRHQRKGTQLVPATEEMLTSCNLWIRTSLLRAHPFPEDYKRTEETALLLDLQKLGAHLFYHPALQVGHHRRKTLKSLWHPTFYAGFYRSKVLKEKSPGKEWIFWMPSLFVLLHLTLFFSLPLFLILARIYLTLVVMMGLNLGARYRRLSLFPAIAFLHHFIVFVYGLGFLSHRMGWHGN